MRYNLKYRVLSILLGVFIISVAVYGASYLGRLYLGIIKEGQLQGSKRVNSEVYTPVMAGKTGFEEVLNPLPVYYLQIGVYSDMTGATEAVKPVQALGYRPYVTQSAPYKVWIGVFSKRSNTELLKQQLRDKGIGSFSGSIVINGSTLTYNEGSTEFVKSVTPLLETYTSWLKEAVVFCDTNRNEWTERNSIKDQALVVEKVYGKLLPLCGKVVTNTDAINYRLSTLKKSMELSQAEAQAFTQQTDPKKQMELQNRLLAFIDEYLLLWQEINNLCKS
jgi:hypothetical protein